MSGFGKTAANCTTDTPATEMIMMARMAGTTMTKIFMRSGGSPEMNLRAGKIVNENPDLALVSKLRQTGSNVGFGLTLVSPGLALDDDIYFYFSKCIHSSSSFYLYQALAAH